MTVPRIPRSDLFLALAFGLVAFVLCYAGADLRINHMVGPAAGTWFDSDLNRVLAIDAGYTGGYDRTTMHPLYGYVARAAVTALKVLPGGDDHFRPRVFHSLVGGAWIGGFFLLLRAFRVRRWDAALFTAVLGSSAAAFMWAPSFETFVLGSLSMFPALLLAARPTARTGPWIGAGVAGLGITVTNVMAPFFAAAERLPRRKLVATGAAVLCIGAALTALNGVVFPASSVLLRDSGMEWAWVLAPESRGGWGVVRAFFFHGMVAPEFSFIHNFQTWHFPFLSFQASGLLTGGTAAVPGTAAWAALLTMGGWALTRQARTEPAGRVLILLLLGQLLLHLLYGRETFLYAAHIVPLLVLVAAMGARTPLRPAVLVLAAVLCACNLLTNVDRYRWAKAYVRRAPEIFRQQQLHLLRPDRVAPARDEVWDFRIWKEFRRSEKPPTSQRLEP